MASNSSPPNPPAAPAASATERKENQGSIEHERSSQKKHWLLSWLHRFRKDTLAPSAYHNDYKTIMEGYAKDPSERLEKCFLLILLLLVSIVAAFYLGRKGGFSLPPFAVFGFTIAPLALRGVTCWEVIAVLDTIVFAWLYFSTLKKQAKTLSAYNLGPSAFSVGALWTVNIVFLFLALFALLASEVAAETAKSLSRWLYLAYLILLTLSFLIFTRLDYVFARDSRLFKKTREYRDYSIFVDGPASIAFIILLAYFFFIQPFRTLNVDIVSGAVVMQMLIADTLYLVIASNFHNWLLANRLSRDCQG